MSVRLNIKTLLVLLVSTALSACGDNDTIVSAAPMETPLVAPIKTIPVTTFSNNIRLDEITFTDAKLAACVEAIAKANQWTHANQVISLNCSNKSINSLGGIQRLSALQFVDLSLNQITVLKPIAQLNKLQKLNLAGNALVNIEPIANLTTLTQLNLGVASLSSAKNNIRDITALANLSSLKTLDLSNNQIGDITPLRDLNLITQ